MSITLNFVAIVIISQFDEFVFASMKNEKLKSLIETKFAEKVFVINHTSSKNCKDNELSEVRDEYDK